MKFLPENVKEDLYPDLSITLKRMDYPKNLVSNTLENLPLNVINYLPVKPTKSPILAF